MATICAAFAAQEDFEMATFAEELSRKLAEEASENTMHDAIEGAMRRAADKGESGKDIAKSGIGALFSDASPVMRTARSLRGFVPRAAYPIIATVGATALAKWAENFLPGDNRPGIKEARFILKYVAPHLVIGAAEAFGEVASQIDQQVDSVRSDATTPDALRDKSLDFVVEADMFPDRIFVPARDSDGKVQTNSDGTPVVLDRDYAFAQRMWDQTHKPEKKTTGGNKNQPQRIETIPANPFPCKLVPLSVALTRISQGSVQKGDLEEIKKMLKKPDSWGAKLSARARDLLLALSVSRSKKGPLEQTLAEDFFKDLPNKGDIALIEHLAERFESCVPKPSYLLSDADFDSIVAFIDDWLGAELTWQSKLQRSCARIWRNRGSISTGTSIKLKIALYGMIVAVIGVVFLFISCVFAMIYGIAADLTPPLPGKADPRWLAAVSVFIGAWVITILLFLFRPLQGVLSPIAKIFGAGELWLTSFGFKFTLLIAPFGFLLPLAILTGASMYARFLIIGIPLLAIGIGMAYKAADVPAMSRVLTIRGAKYGWIGGLLIIAIDWLIRNVPWMTVAGWIKKTPEFVSDHQILASAIFFAIALVLGHLFIVRPIERTKYRSGNSVIIDKKTSWFARLAVIAIALTIAILPWVKMEKGVHDFDPIESVKQWQTKSNTQGNPNPVLTQNELKPNLASGGHQHFGKLNCSELSPEGKEAVGCE